MQPTTGEPANQPANPTFASANPVGPTTCASTKETSKERKDDKKEEAAAAPYLIGKLGSNDLPVGTVPIPFDEIEKARDYFISHGKTMGRPMCVGDEGGGGGGWGGVPSGFSLQKNGSGCDGSAHFNKNVNGDNNGCYFPVGKVSPCSTPVVAAAAGGETKKQLHYDNSDRQHHHTSTGRPYG